MKDIPKYSTECLKPVITSKSVQTVSMFGFQFFFFNLMILKNLDFNNNWASDVEMLSLPR